jgi:molecular chaperone HscC
MEVKSVAGDNYLGGNDFTELLEKYFLAHSGIPADGLDLKTKSAVLRQAEELKCKLSSGAVGEMRVRFDGQEYTATVTRQDFEALCSELLDRLRRPVERVLHDASLSPSDLSAVILVGGATRMPMVRAAAAHMFKRLPYGGVNPDEVVALGAAVQAALKSRNQALSELVLTDVCPYTMGVEVTKEMGHGKFESGYYMPVIERNTPIPVSRVENMCTLFDNQSCVNLKVYQGESYLVKNNILLGSFGVEVPPAPARKETLNVRFTYDVNGILEVEATVLSTGLTRSIVIEKNPGSVSEEELQTRLKAMQSLKIHPRDRAEYRLLLARAERLYEELRGDERAMVAEAIIEFKQSLDTQDTRLSKQAAQRFCTFLNHLEGVPDLT